MLLRLLICTTLFLGILDPTLGQTGNAVTYVSQDDQDLTIQKVVIADVLDNVSGVYSKPLTDWLVKKVETDNQWNPVSTREKIESDYLDPEKVQKILSSENAQALITARVLRGPQGLSYRMTFFVGRSGFPLVQEFKRVPTTDSLDDVMKQFASLYDVILSRFPYDGVVLSRNGRDVTISIGDRHRLRAGNQIDVIQILKVQRHPKHQFMVASEKAIIGKIQLTKVDETLSFGRISFEKEANVIRPGQKVISQRMIKYPSEEELLTNPQFGDSPTEWTVRPDPQFGKVTVWAGLGQYSQTADLNTIGGIDASNPLSPTVRLDGELWLNPEWFLYGSTMQSAFNLSNPVPGDSPSNLSTTLSSYTLAGGYTWLLGNDFLGPKIQASLGLHQWTADPARSAPAQAFSRTQFGGLYLGFNGFTNVSEGSPWDIGAQFKFFVTKSVSESPSSGGDSNVGILDFSVYTRYRKSVRMSYLAQLSFENYSADFSGTGNRPNPATEITHKNTLVLLGIEYAF